MFSLFFLNESFGHGIHRVHLFRRLRFGALDLSCYHGTPGAKNAPWQCHLLLWNRGNEKKEAT